MLNITNLTVYYNNEDFPSLKNFSLDWKSNGLIVIAGNSGSGKSTFAKAIFNLLPNNSKVSGTILLNNQNIAEIPEEQVFRTLGFLPQFPSDYVLNLLVYDEIAFPLENLGFSKSEIAQRIEEVGSQLRISHLKSKIVTELSSGELQKVALATALVSKPSIIVLDEPFARIDSDSEISLINSLSELKKSSLIIVLEHHLDYILDLTDYMILLDNGQIISQGIPQKVLNDLKQNKPEISKILIPPNLKDFMNYDIILNELKNVLKGY